MNDVLSSPATSLARAIVDGDLSVRQVVEAHLARLDEIEELNAVVTRCDDRALREADAADQRLRDGDAVGPLHGLPFTVKDAFETEGVRTTAASPALSDHVPERDATVVRRLRDAGAILIGKTNTAELTLRYETDNALFGQTWNPHGSGLSPGGSSGGSAAVVAAEGAAFDVGTDTGGSVRLPAHFCGIVGLKPTQGRVPLTGLRPSGTPIALLTQPGPLTRTVADAKLLLEVIQGPDGSDPLCLPLQTTDGRVDVAGLRVGVVSHGALPTPTDAVAAACEAAADGLRNAGYEVASTRPGPMEEAGRLFVRFFMADGGAWLRRLAARLGAPDSPVAPPAPEEPPPASDWSEHLESWLAFRTRMQALLDDHDLLLLPVHPEPARPPYELERPDRLRGYGYAVAFNLTGWPAIVVPAGATDDGLPVAVQLVAASGREDLLLAAAAAIADAASTSVPRPR
ncbi:MAG: amidase [Nitriliruptorales bacterium]|nr:amidase [Nitriliruptorales bacterium]